MPGGGVNYLFSLAIPLEQFGSDSRMTAFHFVVGRFSDVVAESAASSQRRVEPHLLGEESRNVGNLDRVTQHVLAIAGSKVHPPHQVDQLVVQTGHVGFQARLFAKLLDVSVHFLVRLFDDFFDPRRMDAAVLDQLDEGEPGHFAADLVECRDDDDARRVIDDDVNSGEFFEGANVASLATDDTTFHFVVRDVDRRDSHLGRLSG